MPGIEIKSEKRRIVVLDSSLHTKEMIKALEQELQFEVVDSMPNEKDEIQARIEKLKNRNEMKPVKIPEYKNFREKYFATRKFRCQ